MIYRWWQLSNEQQVNVTLDYHCCRHVVRATIVSVMTSPPTYVTITVIIASRACVINTWCISEGARNANRYVLWGIPYICDVLVINGVSN